MRDMLPPIFQILTGLSFAALFVIGIVARPALKPITGRLTGGAILLSALGFFLLSRATGATSIGAGAELFIGAGASFFTAVVLLAASIFIKSRSVQGAGTGAQ